VQDGLPVLLNAAMQEQDPVEVQVRFAAIEAISTLADNCGPKTLQENEQVLKVLLDASHEPDDTGAPPPPPKDSEPTLYRPHAELRAVSAYALGVIGGKQATERLVQMLHDTYPNARYNAATGLARQGNGECIGVLREMLDPDNPLAVTDEANPNDQARKRTTVLLNGIKATIQLGQANPDLDLGKLDVALENLAHSPLENVLIERGKVKNAAAEARNIMQTKQTPAKS
jgi:HEAT repeat protein